MSLRLCVLGSGSAGNCSLIEIAAPDQSPKRWLIDAGLTPRQTNLRLGRLGLSLNDITDILITHPDTDHLHANMVRKAEALGITMHLHTTHLPLAFKISDRPAACRTFVRTFELDGVAVETTRVAHDDHGAIAYRIDTGDSALGYATDLGHVTDHLLDLFTELDGLAIESNYDREMQLASPRPAFLKRRIMNGLGHLSNEQSLDAVARLSERSSLQHIALLHLSRQCNCPSIITAMYRQRAAELSERLTISNQYEPTPPLHIGAVNGATAGPRAAGRSARDASAVQIDTAQPSLFTSQ